MLTATIPLAIDDEARSHRLWLGLSPSDWVMAIALVHVAAISSITAIFDLDLAYAAVSSSLLTILTSVLLAIVGERPARRISALPIGTALILFIAFSALSCQIAGMKQIRYDGAAMWRQLALAMLPIILFWGARAWSWQRFSVRGLDIGMTLLLGLCTASIVLDYVGLFVFESYGSRHFGFLGDSVAWIATLPTVYFIIRGRLILFGMCVLLSLFTQTRGALLITGIAIGLHFLLSPAATARIIAVRMGALGLGLAAAFLAQGMVQDLVERFQGVDLADNDRTRTIEFTLEIFRDHPVIGSGYNAHAYFFEPYQSTLVSQDALGVAVSTPLQILADAGFLGFVPFLAALLMMIWLSLRAIRMPAISPEVQAVAGLAAWLVAFVVFDQSAAWLIPLSLLPSLVFLSAGVVAGAMARVSAHRRAESAQA